MKYISIDLETSGLDEHTNQILEFSAIIDDSENPLSFEDSPKFTAYLCHEKIVGDVIALSMNRDLITLISNYVMNETTVEPLNKNHTLEYVSSGHIYANLLYRFNTWLVGNDILPTQSERNIRKDRGEAPFDKFTVAGKNFNAFDRNFLKAQCYGIFKLFRTRAIDPATHYLKHNDTELPNLTECLKRAGLGEPTNLHNGLADCWDVIRLVRQSEMFREKQ